MPMWDGTRGLAPLARSAQQAVTAVLVFGLCNVALTQLLAPAVLLGFIVYSILLGIDLLLDVLGKCCRVHAILVCE